ncbi:hypothetical protein BWO36_02060 [Staphylococcus haemolyticus]|nr:hypothetical protein BWO36_02060 [Staphylococcus haemolyticus]
MTELRRCANQLFSALVIFAGCAGLQQKNFTKKFYKQCKLGIGALAKRISLRNSTSNASWGYNEFK